jgi:hypothetical protein
VKSVKYNLIETTKNPNNLEYSLESLSIYFWKCISNYFWYIEHTDMQFTNTYLPQLLQIDLRCKKNEMMVQRSVITLGIFRLKSLIFKWSVFESFIEFSWLVIEAFLVGHKRKPVSVWFNTEVLFAVKIPRKQKKS